MIVQRDKPIKIWGWADRDEKVVLKFHNQSKAVKADEAGQWSCLLSPESAGGPYELSVTGNKNTLSLKNILMGDVWICGGQSNMEFWMGEVKDSYKEIQQADYSEIRQFKVQNDLSWVEEPDIRKDGHWETATSGNIARFSAVAYFFARSVYQHTHVPIGLINDNWGGTNVETWTSRKTLERDSLFSGLLRGLPPSNLDSINHYQQAANNKILEMPGNKLPGPADVKHWKDVSYDDSQWQKMYFPGQWRSQSIGNIQGAIWFRKTIRLNAAIKTKATLDLPWVAQSDSTFVNGVLVGATTNRPQATREYPVPPGLLKQGDNVISMRISDSTNMGGISGYPESMCLLMRDTSILISGAWLFRIEKVYNIPMLVHPNIYPSLLYNAMIYPITNLAVKGVIWYQGESNVARSYDYAKAFPLMINDWREQFKQPDLPFLFAQISSFNWGNGDSNRGSNWAELREAQTKTLSLKNTGMAVTIDIGDRNNIHPTNKQDVGKRLAAIALNKVYGEDVKYKGPSFSAMEIKADSIILTFADADSGLVINDKYQYLKGFEIAGADHVFHYAKAIIENNKVVIYSEQVTAPLAIHYAWADDAGDSNLYNKDGFPAVPFRTDNWKTITKGAHYKILEL